MYLLLHSVDAARSRATAGYIDPISHVANQRIYLFSGTLDGTVRSFLLLIPHLVRVLRFATVSPANRRVMFSKHFC